MHVNETATQLAIDADFFDRKAQELWELISELEAHSVPQIVKLHLSVSSGSMQDFPLLDAETLHGILLSLISYYRKRRFENISRLTAIKQAV